MSRIENNGESGTLRPEEIKLRLEEDEMSFRTLADQSLMGIAIIQDELLKYVNQKFADLLDYSIEEIMKWGPKEFYKVIGPESIKVAKEQSFIKQMGLPGAIENWIIQLKKKSGKLFYVNNFSKTIVYQGRTADYVTIIDVTKRLETERKLEVSEKKHRKAYELANLYKDLLTHDVNNVVAVIQGATQLYSLYENNPEQINELIEMISKSSNKAKKLVANVRILSQVEGDGDVSLKSVDILNCLNEAIDFTCESFKDREVHITVDNLSKNIITHANDLLINTFENILNNGVKYNNNPKVEITIKISKERKGNRNIIKIEFIDNGIGISDEFKETIFQRGNLNIKGGKGLGFGLSVVKKVIELYNGKIWVENRIKDDYSKGSKFILLLPRKK